MGATRNRRAAIRIARFTPELLLRLRGDDQVGEPRLGASGGIGMNHALGPGAIEPGYKDARERLDKLPPN